MTSINVALDGVMRPFQFEKLVMAGYTGRDQGEVRAHIDELRAQGIPAPAQIPTLFPCAPELLTTATEISVLGDRTSGEGEVALFVERDEILVGVGSDHTDRQLEMTDIPRSKQVCAKPIARDVWRLVEVADHWDELIIRSWTHCSGEAVLYQEGPLSRLMTPEDVLAYIWAHVLAPAESMVVFAGTLPLRTDGFRPAASFAVELTDPRRNRSLRCAYSVRVLEYLR